LINSSALNLHYRFCISGRQGDIKNLLSLLLLLFQKLTTNI